MQNNILMNQYQKLCSYLLPAVLLFGSCRKEVDLPVNIDFAGTVVSAPNAVPADVLVENRTTGAYVYQWTFEGGSPATSDKKDPGLIHYEHAGTYRIRLEAWNDGTRSEKTIEVVIDSVVHAGFALDTVVNVFGPSDFQVRNHSSGAVHYSWTAPGGTISDASAASPRIHFPENGVYTVTLVASGANGISDTALTTVQVLPALSAHFNMTPSLGDEDNEVPFSASLESGSVSATEHRWLAEGGALTTTSDSTATVHFSTPGTYVVRYVAGNGKQSDTVEKTIHLKANSGLRSFSGVRLGINTAQSMIGTCFSTRLGKVIRADEITAANGREIDIVYYGLNESFAHNWMSSPAAAGQWNLQTIPGARATDWVRQQPACSCGVSWTSDSFDQCVKGSDLDGVQFGPPGTAPEAAFAPANIPVLLFFRNADGKKGVVRIREWVQAGEQSHVICDIKVQKD